MKLYNKCTRLGSTTFLAFPQGVSTWYQVQVSSTYSAGVPGLKENSAGYWLDRERRHRMIREHDSFTKIKAVRKKKKKKRQVCIYLQ